MKKKQSPEDLAFGKQKMIHLKITIEDSDDGSQDKKKVKKSDQEGLIPDDDLDEEVIGQPRKDKKDGVPGRK